MSILSSPAVFKFCPQCSARNFEDDENCTSCGTFLQNERNIRILNVVLVLLGIGLSSAAATAILWIHGNIAADNWNGSPVKTKWMFALLTLILTYGIAFLAVGGWQSYTNQVNLKLVKILFKFVWGFWFIGLLFKRFIL